jgi:serine/threonine protein kinase/Tol biopolymer transport system component
MIDPLEIRDLFDRVATLPPPERAAFLARACGADDGLRREVERLLAADARFGSVFDTQPASDSSSGVAAPAAPSLRPRTRLGPYEIIAALGAGGMGEVYKARDTRLDRTVAIKVLSHNLTGDHSARQRFDREARAVAALSHPHICPLFDIGHQDGIDFLVMEFLDGETLAMRLKGGKLSLEDALTHAGHIADALGAAHRAGIVHRDLKPGNIMVTSSGVKLLDFGLAKCPPAPVPTHATKLTAEPLTYTGMILGTVPYMAPEQLEGRSADERTDIFAFGVVLYEMLTGRRAFDGNSSAVILGKILHSEPLKPSAIERLTPASLDELVLRCLAKDPNQRWQSFSDVQKRLSSLPAANNRSRRLVSWALGGVALAVAAVMAVVPRVEWSRPVVGRSSAPPVASAPAAHDLTRLTFGDGLQTDPTFSPDGRFIAYSSNRAGNFDIWVQPVAGGDAVRVTRSTANDTQPSWSPDGSRIVFRSERDGGGLYVVPALGGAEQLLVSSGIFPSWSDDAHVRFQTRQFEAVKLLEVGLNGQAPREILRDFCASGSWGWIASHPDGRVSFLGWHKKSGFGFYTVSTSGAMVSSDLTHLPAQLSDMVHGGGHRFHWTNRGTALFLETVADNEVQNLWKVHVDPSTLAWVSAERLTTGAGADVASALSADGKRLVFSTQRRSDRLWRYAFDAARRRISGGQPLTEDGATALVPDVSADGTMVAYVMLRPGVEEVNLWLSHLNSGRSEFFARNAQGPVWSPAGHRIAYTKIRPESNGKTVEVPTAFAVRDVTGTERLVSPWSETKWMEVSDWSADGRALLVRIANDLAIWPISDPPAASPERVVLSRRNVQLSQARLSPNARWLAVVIRPSSLPNRSQLGVAAADGPPDRPWNLVADTYSWVDSPRWSRDGRRLYFLTMGNLWGTDFDAETGQPIGDPFAITSFDSPELRMSPNLIWRPGMSMSTRTLLVPMHTEAGNLWMLDNVDR